MANLDDQNMFQKKEKGSTMLRTSFPLYNRENGHFHYVITCAIIMFWLVGQHQRKETSYKKKIATWTYLFFIQIQKSSYNCPLVKRSINPTNPITPTTQHWTPFPLLRELHESLSERCPLGSTWAQKQCTQEHFPPNRRDATQHWKPSYRDTGERKAGTGPRWPSPGSEWRPYSSPGSGRGHSPCRQTCQLT